MKSYLFLIILGSFFAFYIDVFILTDDIFYIYLADQYSNTRVEKMLAFRGKWLWLTYLIAPVITFFKILIPATLVYLGLYVSNLKYPFSNIFKACVIAEFVLLVPILFKIIWFDLIQASFTLDEFKSFYPLSLYSLFDPVLLEKWYHYPFKALNLFEVGYWFALAGSLSIVLSRDFKEMFHVVVSYYGAYFVCWILFVVFISLSIY